MTLTAEQRASANLAPELSEEAATALVQLIDNHIEVMRAWQRKLKQPFLPHPSHYRTTHVVTGMPTLATLVHICADSQRFDIDVRMAAVQIAAQMQKERERA